MPEATEPNPPAKGALTSEFWLTVVGVAALVGLTMADKVDGDWVAGAIAFACFGYAASRGVVKAAQVTGDAKVTGFKTDLALYAIEANASKAIQESTVEAVVESPPVPEKPARPVRKR